MIKTCDLIIEKLENYSKKNIKCVSSIFEVNYPEELYKLFDIIIELNIKDNNYKRNYKNVYLEEIGNLNLQQIGTVVTMIFREEHFCNGFIYELIKNGKIEEIVKKLIWLIKTEVK